jgi:hypothetical protein
MAPERLPRRFMLVRDAAEPVGYGLGLPGGSVVCVSWPPGSGIAVYTSDTADRCALLIDGDVRWIDGEPAAETVAGQIGPPSAARG